jgi:hypothetical protein
MKSIYVMVLVSMMFGSSINGFYNQPSSPMYFLSQIVTCLCAILCVVLVYFDIRDFKVNRKNAVLKPISSAMMNIKYKTLIVLILAIVLNTCDYYLKNIPPISYNFTVMVIKYWFALFGLGYFIWLEAEHGKE